MDEEQEVRILKEDVMGKSNVSQALNEVISLVNLGNTLVEGENRGSRHSI
jgi:hypothetical protein